MIHLKPLTHHGPHTNQPHKEGYLKWHYHNNKTPQKETITITKQDYDDTFKLLLELSSQEQEQPTPEQKEIQQLLKEIEDNKPKVEQAKKTLGIK